MKNYNKILFATIFFGFILYFIYSLSLALKFDISFIKIADIRIPEKSYNLAIYSVKSPLSQTNIQVRKVESNELLVFYEKYDYLNSYKLYNDTLKLVLSNSNLSKRLSDTLYLKLPSE
jgi:hypothetical protein